MLLDWLKKARLTHTKGAPMVHCALCKQKFKSKALLNAHLIDSHNLSQVAPERAIKADYDNVWLMNEDLKMENERLATQLAIKESLLQTVLINYGAIESQLIGLMGVLQTLNVTITGIIPKEEKKK